MRARNRQWTASWLLAASLLLPARLALAEPEEPAGCLEQAATWAEVSPTLLRAIAWVESRGDHRALNWNRNGSYDVGLMQINSGWYQRGFKPWWTRLGNPCVNVAAAAWVLKQCALVHGYTWDAVGCYHAGENWRRSKPTAGRRYIGRVQRVVMAYTATVHKRALVLARADHE